MMTIEIHNPELELLLQQRLEARHFTTVEDLLLHLLKQDTGADTSPSTPDIQKAHEFEAWADSFPDTRPLSDEVKPLFSA